MWTFIVARCICNRLHVLLAYSLYHRLTILHCRYTIFLVRYDRIAGRTTTADQNHFFPFIQISDMFVCICHLNIRKYYAVPTVLFAYANAQFGSIHIILYRY